MNANIENYIFHTLTEGGHGTLYEYRLDVNKILENFINNNDC